MINGKKFHYVYNVYLNQNYHEPFEAYFPLHKREVCMVYVRDHNPDIDIDIYNIRNMGKLLQVFIPKLPKYIFHTEYHLSSYKSQYESKMEKRSIVQSGHVSNIKSFFRKLSKLADFTIFGGIALHYYMRDFVDHPLLYSKDYDLNISYKNLPFRKLDDLQFLNYIVYMIHEINIYYYFLIKNGNKYDNIDMDISNREKPYINLYITFSDRDDMNRYLWAFHKTNIYTLKHYTVEEDSHVPIITRCTLTNERLHTILTLKYVKQTIPIPGVKAIMKMEVHKNQFSDFELRKDDHYEPFDFIFKDEIDKKYVLYDSERSVYFNDPIFLTLVYVDLIQKYKRNCESVLRRRKKVRKDKKRYEFLVKHILVPFMIKKWDHDYMVKYIFQRIEECKYEGILMKKLLKFKSYPNIYTHMDEFQAYIIQKADQILCSYYSESSKELMRMTMTMPIQTYKYKYRMDNMTTCAAPFLNETRTLRVPVEICNVSVNLDPMVVEKMVDFLRVIEFVKDHDFSLIDLYDQKWEKSKKSMLNLDTQNQKDVRRAQTSIQVNLHDYMRIYEKMMEVPYKKREVYEKMEYVKRRMEDIERISFKLFKDERANLLNQLILQKLRKIEKQKREEKIYKRPKVPELQEVQTKDHILQEIQLAWLTEGQQRVAGSRQNIEEDKQKRIPIPMPLGSFGTNERKNVFPFGLFVPNDQKNVFKSSFASICLDQIRVSWKEIRSAFDKRSTLIKHWKRVHMWRRSINKIPFMTILYIMCICMMLSVIFYGKYLQYEEEKMRSESIKYKRWKSGRK